ncbi:MAG: hypothetical protein IKM61_07145 [Eubacteriaceae bacterium]|nr:hypothetical protein [Eubacteriaceae bacterium]
MDKYDYIMKYVPGRSELPSLEERRKDIVAADREDAEKILTDAALSAIESMLSMCAMVYMKCMEWEKEKF